MPEIITLTVPIVPPSVTTYRVVYLAFDWSNPSITIGLHGPNSERVNHSYSGATATTLMNQLNTANLSVTSLHRRVIQRLVSDGVLAGVISGTPD